MICNNKNLSKMKFRVVSTMGVYYYGCIKNIKQLDTLSDIFIHKLKKKL